MWLHLRSTPGHRRALLRKFGGDPDVCLQVAPRCGQGHALHAHGTVTVILGILGISRGGVHGGLRTIRQACGAGDGEAQS